MSERDYGPQTGLLKRRLWGTAGLAMVVGLVAGMVLLFDSSAARGGETPPSPWLFVMVSAVAVTVLLIFHRRSNGKE